jgi:hypothetical protein
MTDNEQAPAVEKRRVHWNGPLPRSGDYVLSTTHVGRAYRLVAIERIDSRVLWNSTAKTESRFLAITIERVSLKGIPETARTHPWCCDESEP